MTSVENELIDRNADGLGDFRASGRAGDRAPLHIAPGAVVVGPRSDSTASPRWTPPTDRHILSNIREGLALSSSKRRQSRRLRYQRTRRSARAAGIKTSSSNVVSTPLTTGSSSWRGGKEDIRARRTGGVDSVLASCRSTPRSTHANPGRHRRDRTQAWFSNHGTG